MQHDYFQKKKVLTFGPTPGLRVCERTEYVLAWCSMLYSILIDMQHDYFQKNIWFDLLTPSGVEGVCNDRIRACLMLYVPFPLI